MWNATLVTFQQAKAVVEILSTLDFYLVAKRDKDHYEHKDIKNKNYVTLVGPIKINRRYYWNNHEKKWVFQLDQALSIDKELSRSTP